MARVRMTKAEVRGREPSRSAPSSAAAGRSGRENHLRGACVALLPACLPACLPCLLRTASIQGEEVENTSALLAVFTPDPRTPDYQNTQARGRDGVSRQRRAEGTGAAHRGGWISPQKGLSGT